MQKDIQDKYRKLGHEFDEYIIFHRNLDGKMPRRTTVVVAMEGDEELNAYSRSLVPNLNRKNVVEVRKIHDTWRVTPLTARARTSLAQ